MVVGVWQCHFEFLREELSFTFDIEEDLGDRPNKALFVPAA